MIIRVVDLVSKPRLDWLRLWPIVVYAPAAFLQSSQVLTFLGGVMCGWCLVSTLWRYLIERDAYRKKVDDILIY